MKALTMPQIIGTIQLSNPIIGFHSLKKRCLLIKFKILMKYREAINSELKWNPGMKSFVKLKLKLNKTLRIEKESEMKKILVYSVSNQLV